VIIEELDNQVMQSLLDRQGFHQPLDGANL
jgi:hypothetical protein